MTMNAQPLGRSDYQSIPGRIVRLPEVRQLTGLSRSGLYKRMKEEAFPHAIGLGGRSVGWVESEVLDWINERISLRDKGSRG